MEQSLIEEAYGGVPLGAEAAVVVPQAAIETAGIPHEDRPASVTFSASDAWRG
jgi:hypothetical protein